MTAAATTSTDIDVPSNRSAVATQQPPSIAQFITRMQPEIAKALPKGMDPERVARLALTVVRQSDLQARKDGKPQNSLANCTIESFGGALLTAAALGLEPGVNGECYLVPYKGECTLIVGYQGYAKLFYQHPLAKNLDARAVHANDEFDYGYGTSPYLKHKPARGDRGEVTDYYAVATLSTGASAFVVLSPDEVKALRGGKVGPSGKIADPQRWMERKTALRQLVKLLPKSANLSAALAVDDQPGSTLVERGVPAAIAAGDGVALPPAPLAEAEDAAAQAAPTVRASDILGGGDDGAPEGGWPEPPDDWQPDQPAAASTKAADPEPKATRPQVAKIQATLSGLGVRDADTRHAIVSKIVERTVASTNDLTKAEATDTVIPTLDAFGTDVDRFRDAFGLGDPS